MNTLLALGIFNISMCLVHFVSFSKLGLNSILWKKVRIKVLRVLISYRVGSLLDAHFESFIKILFYHGMLAFHPSWGKDKDNAAILVYSHSIT